MNLQTRVVLDDLADLVVVIVIGILVGLGTNWKFGLASFLVGFIWWRRHQ
jgi:hypothetical protein